MKKIKHLTIVLVLMLLVLSACSGNSTEATATNSATPGTTPSDANVSDIEMNETSQLILGTLLLDETEDQVTVEQAQTMLSLWQLYQTMASEDTTASEELDAIIQQVKKTFTDEQLAAMETFDYNNWMQIMADLGLQTSYGATREDETGERPEVFQGDSGFSRGGSDMVGGGFVAGDSIPSGGEDIATGRGMTLGEDFDPEAIGTAQAERGGGFDNLQSLMFIPAVIEYLEAIIAA